MPNRRWILLHALVLLASAGCASASVPSPALFVQTPKPIAKEVLTGPQGGLSKRLGDLLSSTRAELDGIDDKYAPQLSKLATELGELRQSEAPTAATRLTTLQQEYDSIKARKHAEQTDVRYAKGMRLLDEMIGSSKTAQQIIAALTLEDALPQQKNHWEDQELRNDFDAIRDWGLVSGAGIAIVGGVVLAIGGGEPRPGTGTSSEGVTSITIGGIIVAAGAGVLAASALLGHIAGAESGDKLKEKAKATEDTRRVHDELSVRIERLAAFDKSLQAYLVRLETLKKAYDGAGQDTERRRATLAKLEQQVRRFVDYAERMSELLDWFSALSDKYGGGVLTGELGEDIAELGTVVDGAKRLFRDGVTGFLVRQDEIAELFGHE